MHAQATASSIGMNPIAAAYGPVKVKRTHLLLATYGVTSPTEAGHMTHAHTFNNKCAPPDLCIVLNTVPAPHDACRIFSAALPLHSQACF